MKKGEITQTEISAGYCPHCKAFFVNPQTTGTLLKDDIQILHPLLNYDEFRIYTSKRSQESTEDNLFDNNTEKNNLNNESEKLFHCVDDFHLLIQRDSKPVIINGEKLTLPILYCPHCGKQYTSIDQIKDLGQVKLSGEILTNLSEEGDTRRLSQYLDKPHTPQPGARCFVYKIKPLQCPNCKRDNLQNRKIKYLKKDDTTGQYNVKYCQFCGYYCMHYSIYSMHYDDWLLENKDDYSSFAETSTISDNPVSIMSREKERKEPIPEHSLIEIQDRPSIVESKTIVKNDDEDEFMVSIVNTTKSIALMDKFEGIGLKNKHPYKRMVFIIPELINGLKLPQNAVVNLVVERSNTLNCEGDITFTQYKQGETDELHAFIKEQITSEKVIEYIDSDKFYPFDKQFRFRAQTSRNRQGYGWKWDWSGGYPDYTEGTFYGETTNYAFVGAYITSDRYYFYSPKLRKISQ